MSGKASIKYPALTEDLKGGIRWHSIKYFGAGAIIASVTIGSGETFFASRGGAIFGYTLLWCFVASAIMKGVQVYTAARHMTLTGVHPMTHWGRFPGPKNWVPWFFAVISIACFPFWLGGLPLFIGKTLNWIFGIQGSSDQLLLYARVWGTLLIAVAVSLTWFQSYGFLEKAQTVIVGILLISMLAACFATRPDWLATLTGTFVPSVPDYEPWVKAGYPEIADTTVYVAIGGFLGAIGGGTYDYIGYVGCFREKRWGLIGTRNGDNDLGTLPISIDPANVKRGLRWLIPAKIDVGVAFFTVLVFTVCFVVLGAAILHPAQKIPSGHDLLTHQASFLTQFHPAMVYVYQVGIFMAFFGTIYGGYEIYLRTAHECLHPLSERIRRMSVRHFRAIVLTYCAIGGLTLLWTVENPVRIVEPAAIVGGVFTCGLWCFAMIWTDRKFLPKAYQMKPTLKIATFVSGLLLTSLGVKAISDYIGALIG